MPYDTVVIPTDGSQPALRAAREGFELADALGADVYIVSVADSSLATGVGYSGDSASVRKRLREKARQRAESLGEEAAKRGIDATVVVREGIPAKQIVDYAEEVGADIIVIGTSGRGGVARAVMGSVADKVVRTSPVPVVTVRPEENASGETV